MRISDNGFALNWLVVLSVVVAGAVYAITAQFELLDTMDDRFYILLNETVNGISREHVRQAFTGYYIGNYAPLHILSYMLDHALWGYDPLGYHLENVFIHLINGLLFYLFLRGVALSRIHAAAAVFIFLLHPVQVESVAWVSQRKNLLAMLFFLVALLCHQAATSGGGRKTMYSLSLVAIAAAMLFKAIAVIFPMVTMLYDRTYGCRDRGNRGWHTVGYTMVAVAAAIMAMSSQVEQIGGGRRDLPGGSTLATLYTMVPVFVSYIRDCIFPSNLSPFYKVPIRHNPDAVFMVSAMVLLAVMLTIWYFRRYVPVFWSWLFFIALIPVMQIVPMISLKNDRYLYFPMLGAAVLAVCAGQRLLEVLPDHANRVCRSAMILFLLALPVLTLRQTLTWRNDVCLWSSAAKTDPDNQLAWLQLSKAYTIRRDAPNAMIALAHYEELYRKYGPVRGYETQY